MITPGSANALLLSPSGYQIPYSLRFRASNSAYLQRTIGASSTSTTIATWSFWIKRGAFGAGRQSIVYNGNVAGSGNIILLEFTSGSEILAYFTGSTSTGFVTNALFRDPSAWYHVVLAYDSTQATDSNRSKLYVNGTQITSFASVTYPALNQAFNAGSGDYQQMMGLSGTQNTDGYMAEVNFIDGQALTPSSFGQTDSATGVWVPKRYGGTYGTNGFYLKFADASAATASAIGKDSSGNGNNFPPSGISVTSGTTFDQMLDTPTLNYCVMSAVDRYSTTMNPSDANLAIVNSSAGSYQGIRSTVAMTTGKWYCEGVITASGSLPNSRTGAALYTASDALSTYGGVSATSWAYFSAGQAVNNNVSTTLTGGSLALNDVFQIAFDADAGKLWFGKNGTWLNSGDPATGANAIYSSLAAGTYFIGGWAYNTADKTVMNFGQRAFAYTPPTGFKALNTANLPTPSIKKSSTFFDATLRTGTGATASVSSLGFQPDWVWIKSRSNGTAHNLFNSVRGATKGIQTTGPNAEYTDANSLTAFNANGYSLGTDASSRGVNINTNTYVDWAWKESTTAGLDILSWTGDGTGARTINHALGVTPEFIMLRGTDARVWACWFSSMTSAAYYMDLGTVAAEAVDTTMFDSTAPTSTTFRVGSYNNVNAITYVGYFFSSISGFSRIGSYTGNASTDGPFVWCGFRPKFVMVKGVDVATGWFMVNPSNSANEVVVRVFSDTTGTELSNTYGLDLLSNGFKVRAPTGYSLNNSGNKYAFIAFAENPFKYARAR